MHLGKTIGILALGAAIISSGCNMATGAQDLAHVDADQPRAELVIEDHYNPVHGAGMDAIQKEATNADIVVVAPTEIAEHLSHPSVEGLNNSEMQSKTFSARFESGSGNASYEVVCTSDGVGSGITNGSGPLTMLSNGWILQQSGAGKISSDWVKVSNGSNCQVVSEGMSMSQTAHMTSSLQTFSPSYSGMLLAQ